MIKRLRSVWQKLKNKVIELKNSQQTILKLKIENLELKNKLGYPNILGAAMQEILTRDIAWFNYEELDQQSWQTYYIEAQNILKSSVFNNEINAEIETAMRYSHQDNLNNDPLRLRDTRTIIIALERLRERFKSIENVKQKNTTIIK